MAERRMFAKTIIDSDAFLEMPHTTQLLYFHLSMRADDDGFINNPKNIMRMIGCKDDDMAVLITKKFIIPFESGIVVIKHWKIHNYIAKDRYKETKYKDEKSRLLLDENNSYTECIQDVYEMDTQVRLGKDSIGKNNNSSKTPTLEEIESYIKEKELSVNGKQFYDYFTEGNWIDSNGKKVKSWKQKLLTWNKYADKQTKTTEIKQFQNYNQREYRDLDSLYANL